MTPPHSSEIPADGGLWAQVDRRVPLRMVFRVGLIVFTIEAVIMLALLIFWQGRPLTWALVLEGIVDSTLLTLIASPMIYAWVAAPFVRTASEAQTALAEKVSLQAEQARDLEVALSDTRHLLDQNENLRRSLQDANRRMGDVTEQLLQKTGAELHDGPAQLLAYALLRLAKILPADGEGVVRAHADSVDQLQSILSDALREIRSIASGLSLPRLAGASLQDAVQLAVSQHQELTGSEIALSIRPLPDDVPQALTVCVYRFVQEALNNGFRHANGEGQSVVAEMAGDQDLVIAVSDAGTGFDPGTVTSGLGLNGMRARIESLNGRLEIVSAPGRGTTLTATLPVAGTSAAEAYGA